MGINWQNKHGFLGGEFDFLISDTSGHLGYFSSAGFGPVPQLAVEAGEKMYEYCEELESLDRSCSAVILSKELNIGDWVEMAERGLYAYDWQKEKSGYLLVARPVVERLTRSLEADVRSFAEKCILSHDFRSFLHCA